MKVIVKAINLIDAYENTTDDLCFEDWDKFCTSIVSQIEDSKRLNDEDDEDEDDDGCDGNYEFCQFSVNDDCDGNCEFCQFSVDDEEDDDDKIEEGDINCTDCNTNINLNIDLKDLIFEPVINLDGTIDAVIMSAFCSHCGKKALLNMYTDSEYLENIAKELGFR
jgi:hypothetical protein